jgi:outer membrane protein assembly factor BamB
MRSLTAATLLLCLVLVRPSASIAAGTVTVLWNASAVNGDAVINFGGAVFDGGVAVNSRNSVKALDASTGRVMWNYSLPDTDLGFSRPVASRGVVYVIAGAVIAFDAKTGGTLWAATMPVVSTLPDGEACHISGWFIGSLLQYVGIQRAFRLPIHI